MKKSFCITALIVSVVLFLSFNTSNSTATVGQAREDTLEAERQKFIKVILDSLKGRETIAADSVFRNIKTFTGPQSVQVRHLLGIMNYWGEALGVSCGYCHNTGNWASDDLRTKRIARDMFNMRITINNDILPKINDLKSKPARVNCGTCHNGKIYPKR